MRKEIQAVPDLHAPYYTKLVDHRHRPKIFVLFPPQDGFPKGNQDDDFSAFLNLQKFWQCERPDVYIYARALLMIVTVISHKGGVGKATTAIYLAAHLPRLAPTILVDGDGIRSATKWSQHGHGQGLPFKVISAAQMAKHVRDYQHIANDTEGNPSHEDFRELTEGCDLMVIPAEPETVATDGLIHTLEKLQSVNSDCYKVLLMKVPELHRAQRPSPTCIRPRHIAPSLMESSLHTF